MLIMLKNRTQIAGLFLFIWRYKNASSQHKLAPPVKGPQHLILWLWQVRRHISPNRLEQFEGSKRCVIHQEITDHRTIPHVSGSLKLDNVTATLSLGFARQAMENLSILHHSDGHLDAWIWMDSMQRYSLQQRVTQRRISLHGIEEINCLPDSLSVVLFGRCQSFSKRHDLLISSIRFYYCQTRLGHHQIAHNLFRHAASAMEQTFPVADHGFKHKAGVQDQRTKVGYLVW